MMADYLDRYYLPAAGAYRQRAAAGAAGAPGGAQDIEAWRGTLDRHWGGIRFGEYSVDTTAGSSGPVYSFQVEVSLGELPPDMVRVELYADPEVGGGYERHSFGLDRGRGGKVEGRAGKVAGRASRYSYRVTLPATRPAADYTPRVVPWHPSALVPLEAGHIIWYR
jgi:starch phosphorylase